MQRLMEKIILCQSRKLHIDSNVQVYFWYVFHVQLCLWALYMQLVE